MVHLLIFFCWILQINSLTLEVLGIFFVCGIGKDGSWRCVVWVNNWNIGKMLHTDSESGCCASQSSAIHCCLPVQGTWTSKALVKRLHCNISLILCSAFLISYFMLELVTWLSLSDYAWVYLTSRCCWKSYSFRFRKKYKNHFFTLKISRESSKFS